MTTIKLKNGSGAPLAGDLVQGEPALDLTNKRLYTENSSGTVIEVGTNPGEDVTFADNRKAIFGAGSDLQIYHDGSHSYISDQGTGRLYVQGSDAVRLTDASAGNMLSAIAGDGVYAYYNTALKLATTSTGIDVTGTVTADGLTVDASTSQMITLNHSTPSNLTTLGQDSSGDFRVRSDNVNKLKSYANGDFELYNSAGTSQDFYWDSSTSRLGLGTTTPSGALHVYNGSAGEQYISSSNSAMRFVSTGGANYIQSGTATSSSSAADLIFTNVGGSGETMRIDSAGNVKVNDGYLEVNTESAAAAVVRVDYNATDSIRRIHALETGGGNARPLQIHAQDVRFRDDTTERMRIDSSGNVGIGTSSPDNKLHVYKGANGHSWSFDAGDAFIVENSDSVSINLATPSANSANILFSDADARGQGRIVYDHSSDYMGFHTAGVGNERMRIDSSGNVGIGTSNTSSNKFTVSDDSIDGTQVRIVGETDENHRLSLGFDTTNLVGKIQAVHAGTAYKDLALQSEGGNVGIGTSSVNRKLEISANNNGSKNNYIRITDEDTTATLNNPTGGIEFFSSDVGNGAGVNASIEVVYAGSGGGGEFTFNTASNSASGVTEKMRIDENGNLLVGKTSASAGSGGVRINNNGTYGGRIELSRENNTGTQYPVQFYDYAGSTVGSISNTTTATAYNTSSDQRLKDNIVDAPSASDDIDAIQVRSFDWKADGSHQKYGMVAQELNTVAPEAVSAPEDPEEMMGVDYSKLVPMMLKEIQSLRARVAQLEGAN